MFSRDELLTRPQPVDLPSASLVFEAADFKAPEAQQCVAHVRVERSAVAHPADAWLAALMLLSLPIDERSSRSLCRRIDGASFIRFFEGCVGALAEPERLPEPEGILDAVELLDTWNEQAMVCVTERELHVIYWCTRA